MAVQPVHNHPRTPGEATGSLAVLPPRRERLAIVSSRNKLCGIAAYTQALEGYLADVFDITVFDLDQYLLRGRHKRVRALADRHIKEICGAIASFDAVNLQLEFGTLGRGPTDVCRRFGWLVRAAPRLSVTFHTMKRPPIFPLADFIKALFTVKWRSVGDIYDAYRRDRKLSLTVPKLMRRAARRKPVSIIVHNRHDLSDARHLHGFGQVFDHPLAFLPAERAMSIRAGASRRQFPLLDAVPAHAKLVGVFGFLNDYKGFSTVVRALRYLPKDHHLLIFGGTHPNEIPSHEPIHRYLAALLTEAGPAAAVFPAMGGSAAASATSSRFAEELSERIHFMGAPDDGTFLTGMAICDAVVFPYLEVGQSASGPIALAVEMGSRIIASRTHAFLEFEAYHPSTIEFFDIGNHLELAERIGARPQYPDRREPPRYNVETNKAVYLAANSAAVSGISRLRRRS